MENQTSSMKDCIQLLRDNDKVIFEDAKNILLKLCSNILKNPTENKYRKIQLSNTFISTKLLTASGAIECLFEIGFTEDTDGFLFPFNVPLKNIENFLKILNGLEKSPSTEVNHNSHIKHNESTNKQHSGFFQNIANQFKHILRYEEDHLQLKAKALIPLTELELKAMRNLRNIQSNIKKSGAPNDIVFEDMLLLELLRWFKLEFFQWVDSPACKQCHSKCKYEKSTESDSPIISRVEIHKCVSCNLENEFIRYTDPEPLLNTREGRCGEWANVFTLFCRSIGFDARLVVDKTDHVWTEVWSIAHNRWIHADPCENVMDQPFLYEKGWGKKLSYVLAYSRDEIMDVTWKYTLYPQTTLARRKMCTENDLINFIHQLNTNRQSSKGFSMYRKTFVIKRMALEIATFLTLPQGHQKSNDDSDNREYGGRTSGSLSWRLSRGEVMVNNVQSDPWIIPKGVSTIELSYEIVSDCYKSKDICNNKLLAERNGWYSGMTVCKGEMLRKEEFDWQMVYLSRSPESAVCKIKWTFSIEDSIDTCIDEVAIRAKTTIYHDAEITWELEGVLQEDDEKKIFFNNLDWEGLIFKDFSGAKRINIIVTLSGGQGSNAWQHAQLFRNNLQEEKPEPSLLITIKTKANTF